MYPDIQEATAKHIDRFTFGSIRIEGVTYEHDVVIARGRVRKRKKKASKPFRGAFGLKGTKTSDRARDQVFPRVVRRAAPPVHDAGS
jgi:hypothetical protein